MEKHFRELEQIFLPPAAHMVGDGFKVHNFFPGGTSIGNKRMSPFFLLDYNAKMHLPPSEKPRGVGVHPHRGFETVTIAYKGRIAHADSSGNSGLIAEGEVQWMTAASGVLHKEYHEETFTKSGGDFQMVQLWVNLPGKNKMDAPGYQALRKADFGAVTLPDNAGTISVIAGEYMGTKGPAKTFTPIEMYNISLEAGGSCTLRLPADYNTGALMIEGSVSINGKDAVPENAFALFKNESGEIELKAERPAVILLLSGQPINEPIAAYGPFLMNRPEEIQQAIIDFQSGKFGSLED